MEIQHATYDDLPRMEEIYAGARAFMAEHGNPNQWSPTNWPPRQLLEDDISRGKSYVCTDGGRIIATFFYDFGEGVEPTYRTIEDGSWMNDSAYGVVHRIAADGSVPGTGTFCLNWAFDQCRHLRIDTHPDNTVMQSLLGKLGFAKRGIIHVEEDEWDRLAYEKGVGANNPILLLTQFDEMPPWGETAALSGNHGYCRRQTCFFSQ